MSDPPRQFPIQDDPNLLPPPPVNFREQIELQIDLHPDLQGLDFIRPDNLPQNPRRNIPDEVQNRQSIESILNQVSDSFQHGIEERFNLQQNREPVPLQDPAEHDLPDEEQNRFQEAGQSQSIESIFNQVSDPFQYDIEERFNPQQRREHVSLQDHRLQDPAEHNIPDEVQNRPQLARRGQPVALLNRVAVSFLLGIEERIRLQQERERASLQDPSQLHELPPDEQEPSPIRDELSSNLREEPSNRQD